MRLKKTITYIVFSFFSVIITSTVHAQKGVGKTFWTTLDGPEFDSTKYSSQTVLFVENCRAEKKTNELELTGSLWIVSGRLPNLDTLPYSRYHIYLATPIKGLLQNKRTIFDNCDRKTESNEFIIKSKIKEREGLYINNCSGKATQEWRIDTLFFSEKN